MRSDMAVAPSARVEGGGEVHDQLKRHEIRVLRQAELPLREVARRAKVSLDTVLRVLREGPPDQSPSRRRGRPPVAEAFQEVAGRFLSERADLPTVEVLRRLRQQGYSGSADPVYRMVRRLRRTTTPPIVLFDGLCGEFSQHDFGAVRVSYEDSSQEILHFFASRLKWSRWVHVEITPNEQVLTSPRAVDFLS